MSTPENEKPDPTTPLPAENTADENTTEDNTTRLDRPAPTTQFETPQIGAPITETPDPATVLGPDQPGGLGTGFSTAPEPAPSALGLGAPGGGTTWNEPPAAPAWEPAAARTGTLTEPAPAPYAVPERRPFRMRTLVLGLILLVVAGAVLLAQLTSVSIDPGVVVLGLMVAAGLMLIAGAARS